MEDTQLALQDVNGPLTAFLQKLGGKHGDEWLQAFKRFLRKENPWPKPISLDDIQVFKTIRLGTGLKSADDFLDAFKQVGCRVSDWARDILGKPAFQAASEETEVDLVVLTVRELGFSEGATYAKICERAQELGLELCPPEVGPQLRLQYMDQPEGEELQITMEPITVGEGILSVLYVGRGNSECRLDALYGDSGRDWNSNERFAFVKPREPRKPEFQVWKTIKLGTGLRNTDDFLNALGEARCDTTSDASNILVKPEFKPASEEIEVDLVVIRACELGSPGESITLGQMYERTSELGLELCPPEVGPQLRLQYLDQPDSEWLYVAMELIADSNGHLRVFSVRKNLGTLYLITEGYSSLQSEVHHYGADRFVFVKPRKG